jgi:hypothetical protein
LVAKRTLARETAVGHRHAYKSKEREAFTEKVARRRYTRKGDKVRFRFSDVFLPSPEEVFGALAPDASLEGVVVSFSDSGSELRVFAVVDVVRRQTLVVPVNKVTVVSTEAENR